MRLLRLLQVPLVLALFAILLARTDISEMRDALADADVWLVVAAGALNAPIAGLFAFRSHFLLARLGHRLQADVALPVAILGNIAGALTPASSGEILRAVALRYHGKVATADATTLVVLERGYSVFVLGVGCAGGIVLHTVPHPAGVALACLVALLVPAPVLAAPLLGHVPAPTDRQPRPVRTALRPLHHLSERLHLLLSDRPSMAAWLVVTAAIFAIAALQFWLLARAIAPVISPNEAWIAFAVSQLAGIISLLPLGLGAADTSLSAILDRFGMTLDEGTGTAILVRTAITIPLVALAILSYLYLAWRTRQGGTTMPTISQIE